MWENNYTTCGLSGSWNSQACEYVFLTWIRNLNSKLEFERFFHLKNRKLTLWKTEKVTLETHKGEMSSQDATYFSPLNFMGMVHACPTLRAFLEITRWILVWDTRVCDGKDKFGLDLVLVLRRLFFVFCFCFRFFLFVFDVSRRSQR